MKTWFLLQLAMLIYSLSSVCTKAAGEQQLFTLPFLLWGAGMVAALGAYALIWQQVLKKMSLTSAYANKAVIILWGLLWGRLLYGEAVTAGKLLGAAVVMAGVALMAGEEEGGAGPGPGEDRG